MVSQGSAYCCDVLQLFQTDIMKNICSIFTPQSLELAFSLKTETSCLKKRCSLRVLKKSWIQMMREIFCSVNVHFCKAMLCTTLDVAASVLEPFKKHISLCICNERFSINT